MERENNSYEREINLADYWKVVWKRKILIMLVSVFVSLGTVVYSLRIEDVYQSSAVITPANRKMDGNSGFSTFAQQLGGFSGISLPASASISELLNLLKSNVLRERAIKRNDLLPLFFPERWDQEKKEWKKANEGAGRSTSYFIGSAFAMIKPHNGKKVQAAAGQGPTTWDGLRKLNSILIISNDIKDNTITITARHEDPEVAARIVDCMLATLMEHMSSESKRIAGVNKNYLENQLGRTVDPIIRQKIYNLIAQQIETSMMAEMKESFAFTIIDPPISADRKIFPNRKKIVTIGFVSSLFSGVFLAFMLEFRSKSR
ncbi:MAG: hypothetical protein HYS21_03770 [Deltaproteobacteria bacterium]|nr:hypothetical protein [Deltaproteobacteria bacterium]